MSIVSVINSSRLGLRTRNFSMDDIDPGCRLAQTHALNGHNGCVNTVQWDRCGRYLLSGSDDLSLQIRDSTDDFAKVAHIQTGHTGNIFCGKFFPDDTDRVVSCSRDGAVRLHNVEYERCIQVLGKYDYTVHKLVLHPLLPHLVFACCEDGTVRFFDVRCDWNLNSSIEHNVVVDLRGKSVRDSLELHSLALHPQNGRTLAVAGCDDAVRYYDLRQPCNPSSPYPRRATCVAKSISPNIQRHRWREPRITGISFDHSGNYLAASYSYSDVAVFHTFGLMETLYHLDHNDSAIRSAPTSQVNVVEWPSPNSSCGSPEPPQDPYLTPEELQRLRVSHRMRHVAAKMITTPSVDIQDPDFMQRREDGALRCELFSSHGGHVNVDTIKEVTFHGACSEYLCSGSDCGSVFLWSMKSGKLVKVIKNVDSRTINCIASNPTTPSLLACSGIDNTVKILESVADQTDSGVICENFDEMQERNLHRLNDQSMRLNTSQLYSLLVMMRLHRNRTGQHNTAATHQLNPDDSESDTSSNEDHA
eukprot:PhF_6_TR13904/c0_g1_i1/m.22351/K11804/WDR42A; WD repeat-containing protein 42A